METAGWLYLDINTLFRNEPDNWITQSVLQLYLLYRARSSGFLSAPKTVCIDNLCLRNHSWGLGSIETDGVSNPRGGNLRWKRRTLTE